ncbi:MAG: SIS domain-containing protein [Candidatus Omnitrophota bacterium]|nr:SIS domain-containing protein [Candidatus Omnitrophota bacterium]
MKKDIGKYHKRFLKLIDSIIATDCRNKDIDFLFGIEIACNLIKKQSKKNSKIFFVGNGGSAAIANHAAIDFMKNLGLRAHSFSDSSLLTCISNDFGYEYVFAKPIEFFSDKEDVLVTISSSGKSKNILKAVEIAESKGVDIITLSGFDLNNPLRSKGVCNFYVPSKEYGLVEVAHQYICHYIADILMKHK